MMLATTTMNVTTDKAGTIRRNIKERITAIFAVIRL
tara:strand:- start:535 stop:642 length:108 start_codon:yes stop_codon:yes gene_type:complete